MNERELHRHAPQQLVLPGGTLPMRGTTLVMGILNVTPDSFSDGGSCVTVEDAAQRALQLAREGADIVDIGGESTRPGHEPVNEEEELRRVIPVIEALQGKLGVPISVDTYKSGVAKRALEAGASILNDIWGAKQDPKMAEIAAAHGCPIILMHNRTQIDYTDFLNDVVADLQASIRIAHEAGVRDEQIWLDPGIGFAKTRQHNLQLMGELSRISELGYPVLLGTSRKRFIREILDVTTDDALEGTLATNIAGIMQGCRIVRVHDVKAMKRAARMTDAILQSAHSLRTV